MSRAERIEALRESIRHGDYTVAAMKERRAKGWQAAQQLLRSQRRELNALEREEALSETTKPGDPADRGVPEDNFGNVTPHSHRAGYGDDKLDRLLDYLRRNPRATLASGEGALLLAEIDRLRDGDLQMQIDWAHWAGDEIDRYEDRIRSARAEIDRLRSERNEYRARFYAIVSLVPADMVVGTLQDARDEYLRTRRILAALREPSVGAVDAAWAVYQAQTWWDERDDMSRAIRAAVAAAEREVENA